MLQAFLQGKENIHPAHPSNKAELIISILLKERKVIKDILFCHTQGFNFPVEKPLLRLHFMGTNNLLSDVSTLRLHPHLTHLADLVISIRVGVSLLIQGPSCSLPG